MLFVPGDAALEKEFHPRVQLDDIADRVVGAEPCVESIPLPRLVS
jgi:hypothetical protein